MEESNVDNRVSQLVEQKLIILPLDESFIPSKYNSLYGKIHYSDKCCFPKSIGSDIIEKSYEVPWIFEITPVRREIETSGVLEMKKKSENESIPFLRRDEKGLERVYISSLDFRSPENYIFVPKWVMDSLNLDKYDIVNVKFVRMKLASLVTLQPLSLQWLNFIENREPADITSLLEQEINKYSTLTAGTTIAINIDGVEYSFFVNKTVSDDGISVWGVRIQDSDVRIEIDTSKIPMNVD